MTEIFRLPQQKYFHYTITDIDYDEIIETLADYGIDSFEYFPLKCGSSGKHMQKKICHNIYFYCEPDSDLFKIIDPSIWVPTPGQKHWFSERGCKYEKIQIKRKRKCCGYGNNSYFNPHKCVMM